MNHGPRPLPGSELRIASMLVDPDGRIGYFGPNAEAMTGFRRSDVIGRNVEMLVSGSAPFNTRLVLLTTAEGQPAIHELQRADGTTRAVHVYQHPVPQPGGGPAATLLLMVDMTDSRNATAGFGLLNAFFQQSAFGFAILDTQLRFIALNEALAKLNRRPLLDHLGRHLGEVIDSSEFSTYENKLNAVLDSGEPITSLRVPGHPTSTPGDYRVWSASWYRLTEGSGRPIGLCGIVMDISRGHNATLHAARSRARLALLSEVGARQVDSLDFHATARDLADLLTTDYCDLVTVDVVNDIVTGGMIAETPDPDTLISRIGASARNPNPDTELLLDIGGPRPASRLDFFARVLVTNRPQLIQQQAITDTTSLYRDAALAAGAESLKIKSVIIAPLRARDTTLGALTCVRLAGRQPFDSEDLVLVSEIANRTAMSIDNSRLYLNEKQTALTLQQSLLPRRLPVLPEIGLAHRYQPTHADLRAGGDWFDTIELPGRRVAFVVGDVVGHSIQSAAAMGHFRTAVLSLASIGLDPAALFTRLNDLSGNFGENITATCVYVLYDPLRHKCVLASAGHPPPVLALPGAMAEVREIAGGPLLGAIPDAEYQATTLDTPPGTRLLLYTDGVVESRTTPIDEGIDRLVRWMRTRRPIDEVCERIMAGSPSAEDDRTVLLAEFHGLRSQVGARRGR